MKTICRKGGGDTKWGEGTKKEGKGNVIKVHFIYV